MDPNVLWSCSFKQTIYSVWPYVSNLRHPGRAGNIIESVDSISRDGPDTPIYVIHCKKPNNSGCFDF